MQGKAMFAGFGGETAKMARRSSRDTHFAKDFAFLRFGVLFLCTSCNQISYS